MVLDQFSGVWNSLLSMLDSIPEDSIAVTVYGLGTLIILWCWTNIARRIPVPVGAISWIIVFAILVTPTVSEGPNASIAPATFGLIFGVLTKEYPLVWSNLAAILFVIALGLLIGYLWTRYTAPKKTSPL